jgi:hypothetical protein
VYIVVPYTHKHDVSKRWVRLGNEKTDVIHRILLVIQPPRLSTGQEEVLRTVCGAFGKRNNYLYFSIPNRCEKCCEMLEMPQGRGYPWLEGIPEYPNVIEV